MVDEDEFPALTEIDRGYREERLTQAFGGAEAEELRTLRERLAAETSDHNATKVKCEVYGHTVQHIGEVIGWDRSQMRRDEPLWEAMARCVVRYATHLPFTAAPRGVFDEPG